MEDREVMELAAKAIGLEVYESPDGTMQNRPVLAFSVGGLMGTTPYEEQWNPLEYDNQAFWLLVDLRLSIFVEDSDGSARNISVEDSRGLAHISVQPSATGDNAHAATRRAIVLAAAEIGKANVRTHNDD